MVRAQEGGSVDREPGAFTGAAWATWHYTGTTPVDVAVARVRKGDFVISIKARGEIRSTHSATIVAPQVPDPRIVKLAESGQTGEEGGSRHRV